MRRNNAEAVLQMPTNADQGADWFIHEVNPAWAGLFLQDEWLEQPETVELVKSLSKAAPLLFFFDADEYGWGYRLFAGGEERAAKAFEVQTPEPSEWTVSMSEDEAKTFRQFGLEDDDVDAFRAVLDTDTPDVTDEGQSRRDRFKSVLGIDEFTWMSYSYLYNEQHMADPLG